jgi:hypothetical protein
MQGVCDAQLEYWCAPFTRQDLIADETLQNLCGCHLLTEYQVGDGRTCPESTSCPATPTVGGVDIVLDPDTTYPTQTPYYQNLTGGDKCDVICSTCHVQSFRLGGDCTQPTCVIDDVTINQFNSDSGNITINQACDGSNCYISQANINIINSNTGNVEIQQNCSQCFVFDDDIITAEQVDCGTLKPSPPSPSPSFEEKWLNKETMFKIVLLTIIVSAVIFAAYYLSKRKSKAEELLKSMDEGGGIYISPEYWETSEY